LSASINTRPVALDGFVIPSSAQSVAGSGVFSPWTKVDGLVLRP